MKYEPVLLFPFIFHYLAELSFSRFYISSMPSKYILVYSNLYKPVGGGGK
jgi:hypothetical protein